MHDEDDNVTGGFKALGGRTSRPGTAGCPPLVLAGSEMCEQDTEESVFDTDGIETGMEGDDEGTGFEAEDGPVVGFGAIMKDSKLEAGAGIKGIPNRGSTVSKKVAAQSMTKGSALVRRATTKKKVSSPTKKSTKKNNRRKSTDEERGSDGKESSREEANAVNEGAESSLQAQKDNPLVRGAGESVSVANTIDKQEKPPTPTSALAVCSTTLLSLLAR